MTRPAVYASVPAAPSGGAAGQRWLGEPGGIVPDSILPSQFFATMRRQAAHKTGEYQLLIALLEDAVQCFQKHACATKNPGRRLFEEAQRWLMTADDTGPNGDAFTFGYVCTILGLDAGATRAALLRWRAAQAAAASPPRDVTGPEEVAQEDGGWEDIMRSAAR
jgi:hypothetical protein